MQGHLKNKLYSWLSLSVSVNKMKKTMHFQKAYNFFTTKINDRITQKNSLGKILFNVECVNEGQKQHKTDVKRQLTIRTDSAVPFLKKIDGELCDLKYYRACDGFEYLFVYVCACKSCVLVCLLVSVYVFL
jgi:hypothetical protein